MAIEFCFKDKNELVRFDNIAENAFFIDIVGCLCQKVDDFSYNKIANDKGEPYAMQVTYDDVEDAINSIKIKKVIGLPSKIKFE